MTSQSDRGAERPFVVVSGLPASGKTTLAARLATALGLPLIDKDDILEAMFEGLGAGDMAWRRRLSRASDEVLGAMARRSNGAILTSFWRHPTSGGDAGTPIDWLTDLAPRVIEVHCECAVDVAVARFQARSRHPGHNDAARTSDALLAQFRDTAARGPLGVGTLVRADTSKALDLDGLAESVRAALRPLASRAQIASVAEGYDRWAATYDGVANATRDAAMARLRSWTSDFAGKAVLEIGCGTGLNTQHLVQHAAQVTAIDISEGMLAVAKQRLAGSGARLLLHDLQDSLPGDVATYDVVVETLVLEHVADLAPVFREAFRVLRPGGRLLLCELHPFRQSMGKQARFATGDGEVLVEAFPHSISDFTDAALGAGLRLARLDEDTDPSGAPRLFSLVAVKP